jgi:dihydrofolate synthase/folylpolyglutamate synthase
MDRTDDGTLRFAMGRAKWSFSGVLWTSRACSSIRPGSSMTATWLQNLPLPMTGGRDLDRLATLLTHHERSRSFHAGAVPYSLDPMRQLLGLLGDPLQAVPVVHVAGSKGKGSVCLLLDQLGCSQDRITGATLSPHVERWGERVRREGRAVGDAELAGAVTEVLQRAAVGMKEPLTLFEALVGAAFWLFRELPVQMAVVEVGIGGRLDATNVVQPEVAVITCIECEHEAVLGRLLSDIAREKAGIIKQGVPVVCGVAPSSPAFEPIATRAEERRAPLFTLGKEIQLRRGPRQCHWRWQGRQATFSPPPGPFGAANAALALTAYHLLQERLGWPQTGAGTQALADSLVRTALPGRCESLGGNPVVYRDGAHTPRSLRAVSRWLALQIGTPPVVILGLQADKRMAACLRALQDHIGPLVATTVPGDRSRSAQEIVDSARRIGLVAHPRPTLRSALDLARQLAGPGGAILVTGSFWLIGELRAQRHGGG